MQHASLLLGIFLSLSSFSLHAATLCHGCQFKVTYLDNSSSGSANGAAESAACLINTLPMISAMPLQAQLDGTDGVGLRLDVGTYEEYARQNGLDEIDIAQVSKSIIKHCLRDQVRYVIELSSSGKPQDSDSLSTSNVGTIGHN